jgi:hypothetical protein
MLNPRELISNAIDKTLFRFEASWIAETALRNKTRPQPPERWLLDDEARLIRALAAVIVPSDESGPGADEADIAHQLDRMLATSPPKKQNDYVRGLLSFDVWAQRMDGCAFADMPYERQVSLVKLIAAATPRSESSSLWTRLRRKVVVLAQRRKGLFPALQLFPMLTRDVMRLFYTSAVAWKWLDYDGPPMPRGYDDLMNNRPAERKS